MSTSSVFVSSLTPPRLEHSVTLSKFLQFHEEEEFESYAAAGGTIPLRHCLDRLVLQELKFLFEDKEEP